MIEIIEVMDLLKIDVKEIFASGSSAENNSASLFLYSNGDINWFATDYLLSSNVSENSKNTQKGMIKYFLNFLEQYEYWKYSNLQGKAVPLGMVTDEHILDYVKYIEDDIGLNRNGIIRRLRCALNLIHFIQTNYQLNYNLIIISTFENKSEKGLINAEWRINSFNNNSYLHHLSMPNMEDYPSRNPISDAGIESLYNDLDKLESEGEKYKFHFLSTLILLLNYTGIRVSEAVNIDSSAIELLRLQAKSIYSNKDIDVVDIMRINNFTTDDKSIKATELIYNKSIINSNNSRLIWIKIKTTKGKNKSKFRLVPLPFNVAQEIVKFYDNYIVNEYDRIENNLSPVNRKQYNKLFIDHGTHQPSSAHQISSLFYEIFSRRYKSKYKRNPHLFRHRFITLLVLQQLKNLKVTMGGIQLANLILKKIQGLTGHGCISTMLHYVNLAEARLSEDYNMNNKNHFDDTLEELLIEKFGKNKAIDFLDDLTIRMASKSLNAQMNKS